MKCLTDCKECQYRARARKTKTEQFKQRSNSNSILINKDEDRFSLMAPGGSRRALPIQPFQRAWSLLPVLGIQVGIENGPLHYSRFRNGTAIRAASISCQAGAAGPADCGAMQCISQFAFDMWTCARTAIGKCHLRLAFLRRFHSHCGSSARQ